MAPNTARIEIAIEAAADALLAVSALETGSDPMRCLNRAQTALRTVYERAEREGRPQ